MKFALTLLVLIVIAVLVMGVLFLLLWNDFVVHHVAGARHASFGAAILMGLATAALAGGASALTR